MNFNMSTDVNQYKYEISAIDILFKDEKISTTLNNKFINSIYIEKDFDVNFFPIFKMNLMLSPKLYHKILINKLTVKFRIRIQKYLFETKSDYSYRTDIINDIFCIYLDDNTPFVNEPFYDSAKELNAIASDTQLIDFNTEYSFYFFKESDVNNSKKIINTVIDSCDMTQAILYLLSEGGFKKVLMSKLYNINKYENVILKPITILGNITYLEQLYGFYKYGLTLFFDFDTLYVIEKTYKCSAWRLNEYKQTNFVIKDSLTNSTNLTSGSYEDKDNSKYYVNIQNGNFKTYNNSILNDQIDGNNLIIIDPLTGETTKKDTKNVQRGDGSYKILTNKFSNDISVNNEMNTRNEQQAIVDLSMGDFDIDVLSVNKEFVLIFENSKINADYGGKYRMSKQIFNLTKKGEEFHINANCTLKKQTL